MAFANINFCYVIIPLLVIMLSLVGSWFSARGKDWYRTIRQPSITPPDWIFGVVWTTIFALLIVSVLMVCKIASAAGVFWLIMGLFIVNMFINTAWSYLFFYKHMMGASVIDAVLLWIFVVALMIVIWPVSKIASILFLPYALWGTFAIYLDYLVWRLNRMHFKR